LSRLLAPGLAAASTAGFSDLPSGGLMNTIPDTGLTSNDEPGSGRGGGGSCLVVNV